MYLTKVGMFFQSDFYLDIFYLNDLYLVSNNIIIWFIACIIDYKYYKLLKKKKHL